MYLNIYNSTTMTGMSDSIIDVNDLTIINEESNAQWKNCSSLRGCYWSCTCVPSPDILVHCSLWDNFPGYPHCVVGNCPPSSIPMFGRSHRVILHIHDNKEEHTLWQVRSLRLFPVAPPTTPPSNAGPTGNLFYPVHRPCFVRWGSDAPRTHWI